MLTAGVVASLRDKGTVDGAIALQVAGALQRLDNGKIKCSLTDGKENLATLFTAQASQSGHAVGSERAAPAQVAKQLGPGLKPSDIVRIEEANITASNDSHVMVVAKAEVVASGEEGPIKMEEDGGAAAASPLAAAPAAAPAPPAVKQEAEPAAAKTPGAELRSGAAPGGGAAPGARTPYTPAAHPTPPSAGWASKAAGGGPASAGRPGGAPRPVQPIGSLNPYNNNWSIKAKARAATVVSKTPLRSFNKGGVPSSVFSMELVDEQGTAIEATFWRDAADRAHAQLEEGKVYLFSRGAVKPANKKFSSVRNDYTLHFDAGAEVEAWAGDIDTSKMTAKLEFVPIDQLAAYVDKKARSCPKRISKGFFACRLLGRGRLSLTVDLLGVVTAVQPLGSVKRKSDQAELSRRDLTLVDAGLKAVTVTLWGPTGALGVCGGWGGATLTSINPDQNMWYTANPENGRKVVEQAPGVYYSEYDGKTVPVMVRRYVMRVKRYAAVLRNATWTDWVLRLKASTQEYNGEQRQQYVVADMKPMSYATESRRLLELIGAAAAPAAVAAA
eukprot:scaffold8.g1665.t1